VPPSLHGLGCRRPWSQGKSRSTGNIGLVSGIRGLGGFLQKMTLVKSGSGRVIVNLLPTQQDAQDLDRSVGKERMHGYTHRPDSQDTTPLILASTPSNRK
jgi:hypothetical protein